jgi:hypothetical protein
MGCGGDADYVHAPRTSVVVMADRTSLPASDVDHLGWFDAWDNPFGPWDRVIHILISFAYAAAWGIARRQDRKWVIGLALGVVIAFVYFVLFASQWEASDAPVWLYFWRI